MAILLTFTGTAAGLGFLVDLLRSSAVPTLRSPHSATARDILLSAAGITWLVSHALVYAIWTPPWLLWFLISELGILATVMFPVWWLRMRRLVRKYLRP